MNLPQPSHPASALRGVVLTPRGWVLGSLHHEQGRITQVQPERESLLTEAQARFIGTAVAQPSVPLVYIDHEDRVPGLVAKCGKAWEHIDHYIKQGEVLVHCFQGASRSVTAAIGWVITRFGRRACDEVALVSCLRPQALHLYEGYVRELEDLERGITPPAGAQPRP